MSRFVASTGAASVSGQTPEFTERSVWRSVGEGWRPLHGSVHEAGLSFEWHDFQVPAVFDWGRSFHPRTVEICLNLAGNGRVMAGGDEASYRPWTAGFYRRCETPLRGARAASQRHRFLTVELSFDFLRHHLGGFALGLHPLVRAVVRGRAERSAVAVPIPLASRHQQLLTNLQAPPVLASAQALWFRTKALELAAELFFLPPAGEELFCQRQQRLAAERTERVITLLRGNLAEPPSLETIGRVVGSSPFHLSRIFSDMTGMTIPQYLRRLRLERAAALLRSGKCNVTEAALEVGYSSLSHFSHAFHEMYGCCPGLYPQQTATQQVVRSEP